MTEPTWRGVNFDPESVQAIRAGHKTETRRLVRPQPWFLPARLRWEWGTRGLEQRTWSAEEWGARDVPAGAMAKLGMPRKRWWVRERVRVESYGWSDAPPSRKRVWLRYLADDVRRCVDWPSRLKGTPKIGAYMGRGCHREAARIGLEVTEARLERMQDITPLGVKREGYTGPDRPWSKPFAWFQGRWDALQPEAPFDDNPFVVVYRFKRLADREVRTWLNGLRGGA